MQQQHFPTFAVTPHGIIMDGMPLTKSARQNLPAHTLRSIMRMEEMLKKVKNEDWDNRTAHSMRDVPLLAQAQMVAALASPQPYPPPHKQSWQELTKDAGDDSDDWDGEDADAELDSASQDEDGDPETSSGSSRYNPDEPRIPAGYRDGGQWTSGDNYGPPSAVSDRAGISADNVQNDPSNTVTQVGPIEPMAYSTTQAATDDEDDGEAPQTYIVVPVNQTSGANNPRYIGNTNPQDVVLDDGSILVDAQGNPVQMPGAVSLSANVAFGESIKNQSSIFSDGLSYPFGFYFPMDDADLEEGNYYANPSKELAMIGQFAPYMPMDYQRIYPTPLNNPNPLYVDFGNYNFGVVAAAAGYSLEQALYTAAIVNSRNINNPNVDTTGPNHSNPTNNAFITQGYKDYMADKIGSAGK